MSARRLQTALAAFAVLALVASVVLTGQMRLVVWIVLGGLALKTIAAYKLQQSSHDTGSIDTEPAEPDQP